MRFSFDTLAFVKRLSAAGWDTPQAEALAEALTGNAFDELATKTDLRDLGSSLRSEMKALELRLTTRMGAMVAGSTALTVAILGALITLS